MNSLQSQSALSVLNVNSDIPSTCEVPSLFIQDVITLCERVLRGSLPGYIVGELSTQGA